MKTSKKKLIQFSMAICFAAAAGYFAGHLTFSSRETAAPIPTETLALSTRTPTFPSNLIEYEESDCYGNTLEMTKCAGGRAYESARGLDSLLQELDFYFPEGAWESAIQRLLIPQENWESIKYSYCEFANQDYLSGTIYPIMVWSCIQGVNEERVETILQAVCFRTDGFPRCPVTKPGGEEPVITAISP